MKSQSRNPERPSWVLWSVTVLFPGVQRRFSLGLLFLKNSFTLVQMETKSSSHRFVSSVVPRMKCHLQCTDLLRGPFGSSQTSVCLCQIEVCVSQKMPATVTATHGCCLSGKWSGRGSSGPAQPLMSLSLSSGPFAIVCLGSHGSG